MTLRASRRFALTLAAMVLLALPVLGCATAQRVACAAVMAVDVPNQSPILRALGSVARAFCRATQMPAAHQQPPTLVPATAPPGAPPTSDGPGERRPVTPAP